MKISLHEARKGFMASRLRKTTVFQAVFGLAQPAVNCRKVPLTRTGWFGSSGSTASSKSPMAQTRSATPSATDARAKAHDDVAMNAGDPFLQVLTAMRFNPLELRRENSGINCQSGYAVMRSGWVRSVSVQEVAN
ncbi:hypothetical protein QMZ05_28450 [Bradyrhizobium sp. INPA03-11B]|uniref:hypothetical protein n=1 Tax=Bradyrhizobium sp. INPA03-11B TaxID=418598 RepID=UPI00338E0C7C